MTDERFGPFPYGPYDAPDDVSDPQYDPPMFYIVWAWVEANFAREDWVWSGLNEKVRLSNDKVATCWVPKFWFNDPDKAALYHLTWAGRVNA